MRDKTFVVFWTCHLQVKQLLHMISLYMYLHYIHIYIHTFQYLLSQPKMFSIHHPWLNCINILQPVGPLLDPFRLEELSPRHQRKAQFLQVTVLSATKKSERNPTRWMQICIYIYTYTNNTTKYEDVFFWKQKTKQRGFRSLDLDQKNLCH